MGIYSIKYGNICCDRCKKVLAMMRASKEIMENLSNHPLEIYCDSCTPEENKYLLDKEFNQTKK